MGLKTVQDRLQRMAKIIHVETASHHFCSECGDDLLIDKQTHRVMIPHNGRDEKFARKCSTCHQWPGLAIVREEDWDQFFADTGLARTF